MDGNGRRPAGKGSLVSRLFRNALNSRPGRVAEASAREESGTALIGFWNKLREKVRRESLPYALQSLSRRVPPGLFYANGFIVFALEVPRSPPAPAEGAEIREAGPADTATLAVNDRASDFIRDRFTGGARVWVEERDGRMVGHAWTDARSLSWDHCLKLTGAPGDIWSIDGWVAPDQRGKGCYSRVKGTAAFECGRAGYKRLLAAVDALNRNSIRANLAIGSRPVSRGFTLRLLGFTLVRHDGSLRAGFWSEARPMELRLRP